jgi:hypothetical protein
MVLPFISPPGVLLRVWKGAKNLAGESSPSKKCSDPFTGGECGKNFACLSSAIAALYDCLCPFGIRARPIILKLIAGSVALKASAKDDGSVTFAMQRTNQNSCPFYCHKIVISVVKGVL